MDCFAYIYICSDFCSMVLFLYQDNVTVNLFQFFQSNKIYVGSYFRKY